MVQEFLEDNTALRSPSSAVPTRPSRTLLWIARSLTLVAIVLTAIRIVNNYQMPGPFDEHNLGFCDFHNGVYFPSLAWLQGDNPYSSQYAQSYPVMRQVPLYSPLVFLSHAPLAILPLHVAEAIYFCMMVALLWGCARLIAKDIDRSKLILQLGNWVFPTTALLVLFAVYSRPGHATLYSGYFTLEIILATFLTFAYSLQSPYWAGLALAYTSIKPTYAIPLGLILLAMQRFKTVAVGTVLAVLLGVAPLILTIVEEPHGSWSEKTHSVLQSMLHSQDFHRDQNWERPAVSWTRLDLLGMIAKWTRSQPNDWTHLLVMIAIWLPVAPVLWRGAGRRAGLDATQLTGLVTSLALVTTLVCLYKHAYDGLLLLAPIAGILWNSGAWPRVAWGYRLSLIGLLGLPLVNYLSTHAVLFHPRWQGMFENAWASNIVTSLNAASLFLAMLLLAWIIWRLPGDKSKGIA